MGCLDFTMTQTRNMAYLEAGGFTPEKIEYFVSFPLWANLLWANLLWANLLWANLLWAVAVWGGLLGAALLLAKKHAAVIFIFAVGQLLYARAMTSRGVLS